MLDNPNKIKILLYGNIFRDERSQILTKFLFDSKYHVSIVCPDFYVVEKYGKVTLLEKVVSIFYLIEFLFKAAFADIIYLPPMNNRFIKSAVWAAKLFQKKLIVEVYISLYDTLVRDRGSIKEGTQKAKFVKQKDILSLTKTDYIIHTANHEISYWEQMLDISIDRKKVFIAPLCHASTPTHQNRQFRQDGILRICWWGTFIPLHGLDNILAAMQILKRRGLNFTVNLFGVDNPFFAIYAEKIREIELEQQVFLRKDFSFGDGSLPQYLSEQCDLALGIFGNTDKAANTIPNKLIEALAMGIPTLTMNSPALKEFFQPEDLWTCDRSPDAIAQAIEAIASGEAYPVNWDRTRQNVLNTFSVARYQDVVSKVLQKATAVKKLSDAQAEVFTIPQTVTEPKS